MPGRSPAGLALFWGLAGLAYRALRPRSAWKVLVFAGAEEAIYVFMRVVLGPGDRVVVTWPGYQSLYEVARSTGAEVDLLPLDPANGWHLQLARHLKRAGIEVDLNKLC